MSLPTIAPTGAMASGDYVDYMISYNNAAEDEIIDEMKDYVTQSTIDDWYNLWDRIIDQTGSNVTTLEAAVSKLKAQVRMIEDAINRL